MSKFMSKFAVAAAGIALATGSAPAAAATSIINFEEFAPDNSNGPMAANRYSSLGVTFSTTDDGSTWSGISNGDPGGWGLQGTNGSTFMGFNGSSYSLNMNFASLLSQFSLDAARSAGSSSGTGITISAFRNSSLISTNTAVFGDINQWSNLTLAGSFDEVRITGTGSGFRPFGVDNVVFSASAAAVPEPATWAMILLGFGFIGGTMRSAKRRQKVNVSYA